ncbi:amino acid adenylation domain-containing protein [Kitasatospora sp. NBC_01287]|uniref:non-ribosomal peptide synthetase/MFS transporter n=1 Tax=Kitasatospora sp. NBC_01287 TaxID=2903573 RepID=UPI00224FA9FB|nr:non-ribosomal peptide synthetase [Kitasatospora sp. NBC_01287]MCX4750207.1 amino acid adenylation domain-containing protein [Kitasatospora sp. NBC_01287]
MSETQVPQAGWSDAKRALLAQRLRGGRGPTRVVQRRPAGTSPPLSSGQERLWFMEQFAPGGSAYALSPTRRLRGPLDRPAMDDALTALTARHESLRMAFPTTEEGIAEVTVAEPGPVAARFVDLAGEAEPERRAAELVREAAAEPFDLARGPLLRALLLRLGPDDHVLTLTLHHIVCDGWSVDLLNRELDALYAESAHGRPAALAEPEVRFGDYAAWQRGRLEDGSLAADREYWRTELADVPTLDLPTDRPRPPVLTFEGAAHGFHWDGALAERIGTLSRAYGASRYMVLLAAFQALLARHGGQRDFAIGSPVAGRIHRELEGVVGSFVNMLPIRARLEPELTFGQLISRVRERTLDAYAHQEVPFEQMVADLTVERDVSRSAVFQATFAFQNYGDRAARPASSGLDAEGFGFEGTSTHFDLALYMDERPDGLGGLFTYRTDLFDPATVERLAERFELLVTAAVADPDQLVCRLPVLTAAERTAVLADWAIGPELPAEGPATLTALIAATVAATPDAPALVFEDEVLSYRELDRRANRLARRLRESGVRPDDRVAICLEQSPELAVGLLAALKAGAGYLPMDPEQPPARLGYLLADAGAAVLVTDTELRARFTDFAGPEILLDTEPAQGDDTPPDEVSGPEHLAYVIYTSGSTGQPKGVEVQHRQILNYLAGARERLRIEPGASYGLLQSLSFDFSITMLYLAFATGGRVHLLPRRIAGLELAEQIERLGIDYLKMTPSHLAALAADVPVERLLPAKALVLGGEASSYAWARELAAYGRCSVFNHYGPTEATVGITVHEVRPEAPEGDGHGSTPIGRPLAGARCYVLDAGRRPVPPGVPGELYLGGDRLARGYLGRPELTAERFVEDPYGEGRLYRTGDLVRWRADGTLDFLGRSDHQIKVRGYRVEPGEIEAALAALPGVTQAVVLARGEGVRQNLVAYLERPGHSEPLVAAELRAKLLDLLPDYMIPARYVSLERFPLQAHGKVDRKALPAPEDGPATGYRPPDTPEEELIAAMWADLLDLPRVGALDDFFELGGHSLLATQVVAGLRRAYPELPTPVSVMDLFQYSTVRTLAALVASPDADRGPRKLLHRLTPKRPVTASVVCAPYGGGSALIYKPLADELPEDWALHSLAVPGHELGEEERPFEEVAAECTQEILDDVEGAVVLYGHCGVGVMLCVEIARRLEAAGREVAAVHMGGIFPFARPKGRGARFSAKVARLTERLRSDQGMINGLTAAGLDVDEVDPEQLKLIVRNRRSGTRQAERYFGELYESGSGSAGGTGSGNGNEGDGEGRVAGIKAPVISVIGDRDPATEFYQERFREWHRITDTAAVVVLDEAGHFFLKYRAAELATILTNVHLAVEEGTEDRHRRREGSTWWLEDVSRDRAAVPGQGSEVRPSMGRFLTVAAGQQISMIGSALTEFALPIWIYLHTGSLAQFGLMAVCALVPGILAAPLAGAVVDRGDRRRIMLYGDLAAGATQAVMFTLAFTRSLQVWHVYPLIAALSLALTFQRFAWGSAVPQLVPKRYLGRANGVVQMAFGFAQFLVPLFAVGLLAAVGLRGILAFDVTSYLCAVGVVAFVRFPRTMAWRRRESVAAEIRAGFHRSLGSRQFRAMLVFFAVLNVFLSPLFLLTTPLVLSFDKLAATGWVAMGGGLGATVGGLTLLVWGGPRRHRLRGVLLATLALACAAALTGLRASLPVVAFGAFGMAAGLALVNGIYATIIQTKIPQRFHGRVIAVNTMVAWSTLPIGFAVVAPFGPKLLQPLVERHGALAGTVGRVIGTGAGRGIGLLYLCFGLAMALLALVCLRVPVLARFDREVPDAPADDLVGLETLNARSTREVPDDQR